MGAFARAFDRFVIHQLKKISLPLGRCALFVVFFWFGILKLFDMSPVNGLVASLLHTTLPWVSFDAFVIFLGLLEMAIGLTFLFPKMERVAIALLIPHMFATFLPLVLLPDEAWQAFLVPTFAGQYIIKNLVIIALAFVLASHLHPLGHRKGLWGKLKAFLRK